MAKTLKDSSPSSVNKTKCCDLAPEPLSPSLQLFLLSSSLPLQSPIYNAQLTLFSNCSTIYSSYVNIVAKYELCKNKRIIANLIIYRFNPLYTVKVEYIIPCFNEGSDKFCSNKAKIRKNSIFANAVDHNKERSQ